MKSHSVIHNCHILIHSPFSLIHNTYSSPFTPVSPPVSLRFHDARWAGPAESIFADIRWNRDHSKKERTFWSASQSRREFGNMELQNSQIGIKQKRTKNFPRIKFNSWRQLYTYLANKLIQWIPRVHQNNYCITVQNQEFILLLKPIKITHVKSIIATENIHFFRPIYTVRCIARLISRSIESDQIAPCKRDNLIARRIGQFGRRKSIIATEILRRATQEYHCYRKYTFFSPIYTVRCIARLIARSIESDKIAPCKRDNLIACACLIFGRPISVWSHV